MSSIGLGVETPLFYYQQQWHLNVFIYVYEVNDTLYCTLFRNVSKLIFYVKDHQNKMF